MSTYMDQAEYLLRLAARLSQAMLKHDFAALGQLNLRVHDILTGMVQKAVLSDAEREALALLKIAQREVLALLASESARLVREMDGLNARRAGLQAYAAMDPEDE